MSDRKISLCNGYRVGVGWWSGIQKKHLVNFRILCQNKLALAPSAFLCVTTLERFTSRSGGIFVGGAETP